MSRPNINEYGDRVWQPSEEPIGNPFFNSEALKRAILKLGCVPDPLLWTEIMPGVYFKRPQPIAHPIPPITEPLGKHWDQPARDKIDIVGDAARMTIATLNALHNYSRSNPSGVYDGKMWRRAANYHAQKTEDPWWLCWFGPSTDPKMCTTHMKKIVLTDLPQPPRKQNKVHIVP